MLHVYTDRPLFHYQEADSYGPCDCPEVLVPRVQWIDFPVVAAEADPNDPLFVA